MSVKSGQAVSLDVNIIGEPPPTVTWFFKGKPVESTENLRIDNVDYNTKFFLLKSSRAHSGVYTITAKNSVGEDTAEVDILILGKIVRKSSMTFIGPEVYSKLR